jgi:hypothetical protein
MPKPGYRKPNATRDRYTFKPTQALLDQLEPHRFEGELSQPLYNRLLLQLAGAIAAGNAPPPPPTDHDVLLKPQTFWVRPAAQAFIQAQWQGEDWQYPQRGEKQRTIVHLLAWGALLSPVGAIVSASEALVLLSRWSGQRLEAARAIEVLTERCSESRAIGWLLELEAKGLVNLAQAMYKPGSKERLFGDRRVSYVEVPCG